MLEHRQTTAEELPPHARLITMGRGFIVSRVVYAAAELGLADQLDTGPRSAMELADCLSAHAPSLHRLMRTLASLGILTECEGNRFALTPLGAALKTGAPGSARSTLLTLGSGWVGSAWQHIMYALETGNTGMEKAWGMPLFDYLAQHTEDASLFSQTMVGLHGAEPQAVVAAYDFSSFQTVVDVGGANGNLLAAILSRHAGPRGVLFDRPHVVSDAPALLKMRGVSERVAIKAGDFFQEVPPGGDAYVLSHIVHDWNEMQCLSILNHCRKAMKPDSRLLLVEMVLPDGDVFHPGKILDMVMLVMAGGQERTQAEYAALLNRGGFCLTRVVPTESPVSVIEAVPVAGQW